MMKIERLILRLPPEFAGRERSIGAAIAEALSLRALPTGARSVAHLSAGLSGISPHARDADIASQAAGRVIAGLGREV